MGAKYYAVFMKDLLSSSILSNNKSFCQLNNNSYVFQILIKRTVNILRLRSTQMQEILERINGGTNDTVY